MPYRPMKIVKLLLLVMATVCLVYGIRFQLKWAKIRSLDLDLNEEPIRSRSRFNQQQERIVLLQRGVQKADDHPPPPHVNDADAHDQKLQVQQERIVLLQRGVQKADDHPPPPHVNDADAHDQKLHVSLSLDRKLPIGEDPLSVKEKYDVRTAESDDGKTEAKKTIINANKVKGKVTIKKKRRKNTKTKAKSFSLSSSLQGWVDEYNKMLETHRREGNESLSKLLSLPKFPLKINTTLVEDVFRLGHDLEPYVTESGDPGWKENGVIYTPSSSKSTPTFSPHFDARVPFDRDRFFERGSDAKTMTDKEIKENKKIILFHSKSRQFPEINELQPLPQCPEFPCVITTNRKYSSSSAALVFSGQHLKDRPPKRTSPSQVFAFHNQEPPLEKWFKDPLFKTKRWRGAFNWTMSYRTDSDIYTPYGIIRKRPKPLERNYTAILAEKTGLVAWMISNCYYGPGGRQEYFKELSNYIPVDVYGRCGKECDRGKDEECANMIEKKYKFYLAFENAMCPDYVTEKFFRFMTLDMITVARGGNQYFMHAPSEIFLNTANYASPKSLAEEILRLDANDDLYMDMLRERDKYMVSQEDYKFSNRKGAYHHYHYEGVGFCEMCQKLWNLKQYEKVIPDVGHWFDEKLCQRPADLKDYDPKSYVFN